ncbi:transposase family protein [Ornithinimicrobium flavum]|uniref:transposase family protein n=1 Tax=Ornithinimicrobium flavum TaxID=1288636 RepID=UPI001EE88D97|nr:transposase family protein [Ornithinimicrobium flavum]
MILALKISAVLAGARSFTAIGEWIAVKDEAAPAALGAVGAQRPSESAVRRLLSLDPPMSR